MKKEEREERQKKRLAELKQGEQEFYDAGAEFIAGVDEVGRGPLAGPVVCACVVLPRDFDIAGVDDSKKLSAKRREELAPKIRDSAAAYGFGMASEKVIDEINILEATKGAMRTAVEKASEMLKERTGKDISLVLVDAVNIPDMQIPQKSLVKGDQRSVSIAAASILAKVTRDSMMVRFDEEYPGYDFAANKGYGTKAHYRGLERSGPCRIHRKSFLKKFFEKRQV